jgi:hypothetical protein
MAIQAAAPNGLTGDALNLGMLGRQCAGHGLTGLSKAPVVKGPCGRRIIFGLRLWRPIRLQTGA